MTLSWKRAPLAAVAAAALLVSLPALAAAAPAKEPKSEARALLDRASKTMGESKAWTTRIERGLERQGNTGWGDLRADYTRWIKKPDKAKIDQDNSAYDHPFFRAYVLNGKEAWSMANLNARMNPPLVATFTSLIERADGIVYYLNAADTFFTVPVVPDDSTLAGRGLLRAGCVLRGDTTFFDIDAKTHLLRRRIEGAAKRVYVLDDYRKVSGHRVPFHVVVYDNGVLSSDFRWNEVLFDVEIDDAIFDEYRPFAQ